MKSVSQWYRIVQVDGPQR